MPRTTAAFPRTWSMGDLVKHLDGISPDRIRLNPAPGLATERDVTAIQDHEDRLYELVDGILVEKVMGVQESSLAMLLGRRLGHFAEDEHDLGFLLGADATMRIMPRLVRIPDVSFVSWERVPARKYPTEPIPDLVPNLAVEVLSESNTRGEMERKLKEYFLAGVELVWFVDPAARVVDVYTAPDECMRLTEDQTLDGGKVLPGFKLPLKDLFARVDAQPARRRRQGSKGRKHRS